MTEARRTTATVAGAVLAGALALNLGQLAGTVVRGTPDLEPPASPTAVFEIPDPGYLPTYVRPMLNPAWESWEVDTQTDAP